RGGWEAVRGGGCTGMNAAPPKRNWPAPAADMRGCGPPQPYSGPAVASRNGREAAGLATAPGHVRLRSTCAGPRAQPWQVVAALAADLRWPALPAVWLRRDEPGCADRDSRATAADMCGCGPPQPDSGPAVASRNGREAAGLATAFLPGGRRPDRRFI